MMHNAKFWLPAVRWSRIESPEAWPSDALALAQQVLHQPGGHWVCGGSAALPDFALDIRDCLGHWPALRQAQMLVAATEVAVRLSLLEHGPWAVPDAELAAGITSRVLIRAAQAELSDVQTADWMQAVWSATLAESLHASPGQLTLRRQAAVALLAQPVTAPSTATPMPELWAGLWTDLGVVWCIRALRQLATVQAWDAAPVQAMQHVLHSYRSRNREELPLEDVVSITVSQTVAPAGLHWEGRWQQNYEIARRMVQGTSVERNVPLEPGTERMVGHFAARVRTGFDPRVRMAGRYFVQQLRWDAVAMSVGTGAALRWLLFGATPWGRGYGWRELLRAWSLETTLRWPLLAAVIWAVIGRLGPGTQARGWLVSKYCEQARSWEPPARVELRSRSGVAWAAQS